jgi:hypothetical protein
MKKIILGLFMLVGMNISANAGHIDQLGINISLVSSDGNGSFSVLYQEYFGADGWMWESDNSNEWATTYNASLTASLFAGPGTLSNPGSFTTSFDGIVDSNAVETTGFGAGQLNTHFVNGLSDAAVYSTVVDYTITGFDKSQQYLVDIIADDCCYVASSGSTSFDGQLRFDITQTVPEPATMGIMLLGTLALFRRRFSKK